MVTSAQKTLTSPQETIFSRAEALTRRVPSPQETIFSCTEALTSAHERLGEHFHALKRSRALRRQ